MIYVIKSPTNVISLFEVKDNTDFRGNDYSGDPPSLEDPFLWASIGRDSSKDNWTVCKLFKTKEKAEFHVPRHRDQDLKYYDYIFSTQVKIIGILKEL